jgi:hypothetical protein
MSKERTLANIAETAFWNAESENKNTFDRVANEVKAEVLKRLNKSEAEPVAGQELSFVQVAQWVERHGSTKGLQWLDNSGNWRDATVLHVFVDYRVAPKKVNDPDDPTTWEKGVAIFRRDAEDDTWILDVFGGYLLGSTYKYHSNRGAYKYAKLATPEQIEAWKLINDDAEYAL